MKRKIVSILILFNLLAGCKFRNDSANEHGHEETKVQYTAYNNEFELFAEADVFIVGETANVLSHFSKIPSFRALEAGPVTIILTIDGKDVKQTLQKPTRKGIYSFDIIPVQPGKGTLQFDMGTSIISLSGVTVYANQDDAKKNFKSEEVSKVNTVVFTKEQSWKIEFKTELPKQESFGQVIYTVAQVESASGNETVVVAKTAGVVVYSNFNLIEGNNVTAGQHLFAISSSGMENNNIPVKLAEAKSNYERAEADYTRKKELAKDKIISENELESSKNYYETTKAVYENLIKNFSATGQNISSPMTGFVKQVFVTNGQYVESGQPLITISQSKTLFLKAFVQQKYMNILQFIQTAHIKSLNSDKVYTLEELNGQILSYGKSASGENYLIPVNLQIDNRGSFVQGSFVDIYLKTLTNIQALTIPNTSLLEEQGNYFVYVQITPELFEKRTVKTGSTDGIRTEIVSGLLPNERIVTKGAIFVKLAQSTGALDAHSGHVH